MKKSKYEKSSLHYYSDGKYASVSVYTHIYVHDYNTQKHMTIATNIIHVYAFSIAQHMKWRTTINSTDNSEYEPIVNHK